MARVLFQKQERKVATKVKDSEIVPGSSQHASPDENGLNCPIMHCGMADETGQAYGRTFSVPSFQ